MNDEKNRKQVELFDPQNEPDKSPSMWCVYILSVCAFLVLAPIVAAAFALMAQSIETPAKAQEKQPQKPGWITYHYALPMILRESGGTTTPVPTTTSTVTTTSSTTTLRENLQWNSATPNYLIMNTTEQRIEITGAGFLNEPAFGLKVYIGGIGSLIVQVKDANSGTIVVPADYLSPDWWGSGPPAMLVCYLFGNYSDSEFFFLGLIKVGAVSSEVKP